ncbi:hypothetical protein [Streptomyces canus]|uniref:hypothetical protein n=1 Tax=Streptomyces canus TaxID=58343 RepID=UPI0033BEAC0F
MARSERSLSRGVALGMTAAAVLLLAGCTQSAGPPNGPQPPSPSASGTTAGSPVRTGGCRSLTVPATVKAAVTAAYGKQAQPPLTHIAPVKGTFYYGSCDGVRYAGTRFQPTAGSTAAEQVALQDDGAAMKYFVDRPGTGWRYTAGDGFPADPRGCAAIREIPAALAALWDDCRAPA